MFKFTPFKRKKPAPDKAEKTSARELRTEKPVENWLEIRVNNILLRIVRSSAAPPQNELSAFVPRVEMRFRRYENGRLAAEEEVILSSLTLVDSPRCMSDK